MVALLDSGEAPWAIVTNGKLWRHYFARAHSRATNYYEIDLDETLAMDDPNFAFRYFGLRPSFHGACARWSDSHTCIPGQPCRGE